MPSVSRDQQSLMRGAYKRAVAGNQRSTDPKMSINKLKDFTRLNRSTAPQRAKQSYGSGPVTETT